MNPGGSISSIGHSNLHNYQFPVSQQNPSDVPVYPPCTNGRADIWIYGSEPGFPSIVLELKAVDKLQITTNDNSRLLLGVWSQPAPCMGAPQDRLPTCLWLRARSSTCSQLFQSNCKPCSSSSWVSSKICPARQIIILFIPIRSLP